MSSNPKDHFIGQNVSQRDIDFLRRDKYANDPDADMAADSMRLAGGEPLAYVIGSIPFLGATIYLDSKPLIPRPETEWWTEQLVQKILKKYENFAGETIKILDLCAGSGAIGIGILKALEGTAVHTHVTFAELHSWHTEQIRKNCRENKISLEKFSIFESDLFSSIPPQQFDFIATNPPYIPAARTLDASVADFEPHDALFAGPDGLEIIQKIFRESPAFLDGSGEMSGELWMECDIANIYDAQKLAKEAGFVSTVHNDLYGKPRLLVSHFS